MVPLIQISLFCLCIGQIPSDLNVGYINNETTDLEKPLGKMFLDNIDNKTINLVSSGYVLIYTIFIQICHFISFYLSSSTKNLI
jgi:hypothetical protein